MNTGTVTLNLPRQLYTDLQSMAGETRMDLVEMLAHWTTLARQRRVWLRELQDLRDLIQQEGGLTVGNTKEEVVAQLRKTRQELFEAEYAHLYR